ncbi:MAG TPA: DegT/DnrJ/EryC1/StrS family aminotransferase [Terrimicrobiaceae bacterium]|nr:DegT/DnrJ/EryC1/StrS family aminotransferase [Terrimicrobiaceae bacterium]
MTTTLQSPPRPALALHGGPKTVTLPERDMFTWPIITPEDEAAVLDVLRTRSMSGTDITMQFEKEFAEWMGVDYALGYNNGTASLLGAMYGVGVGVGDEILCPATTFWASALQVFNLGASVVFADIDPLTLCLDPKDIERHLSPRTKAIMVVHYLGHPADMDAILKIADKHSLKVIEDMSHAQGGLYKGRKLGTFGHASGYSLMTGKSFAIGEAGMLTTNDREIYDRAVAFGHGERFSENIPTAYLKPFAGMPMGGFKSRMHQMSSAMGRVQLRHYDKRCAEIRKALNYFWDLLEGVPGLVAHRVDESTGSNMAGWYGCHGIYRSEELGGLSVTRFCQAVTAEGVLGVGPGCNKALHTHPVFNEADVYGHGRPTRIANCARDLRQPCGSLPVSERIGHEVFHIPWFKHYRPELIEEYAAAFRKVAEQADELLADDPGDASDLGGWSFFKSVK